MLAILSALLFSGMAKAAFLPTVPTVPVGGTGPTHSGTGKTGTPTDTNGCVSLPPIITRQPNPQFVFLGDTATFSVEVQGTPPLAYQWFHNGVAIEGANSPVLVLAHVRTADEGVYHVEVSNCAGSAQSEPVFLQVNTLIVDLPPPGTVVNLTGALLPTGLTNIVAVAAGRTHGLALRERGAVTAWTWNPADAPGLTNVPPNATTNVIAIAAGDDFSLALLRGGTVLGWGSGAAAHVPDGLFNVTAIAAGPHRALALKSDGTVTEWGANSTLPAGVQDVAALAAGSDYTLVKRRDGRLEFFGVAPPPAETLPTNALKLAADSAAYAVCVDGSAVPLTLGAPIPPGLTGISTVSTRNGRTLALTTNGLVRSWGDVQQTQVLSNCLAVAAGGVYCLAVTTTPPPSMLSVRRSAGGGIELSAPRTASGDSLESAPEVRGPFHELDGSGHILSYGDPLAPLLELPTDAQGGVYRLRRK
jgi:hypothetical protein